MNFDYENSNQRYQLSSVQAMPIIKFTYLTPNALPIPPQKQSQYITYQTPILNIATPHPQQKRIIEYNMPIPLQGHLFKKRIFDQYDCSRLNPMGKRQRSSKTLHQQKKKDVSRSGIVHTGEIKKRRPIFSSHERKQITQFKTPLSRQKSASHFVLHPCSHPNSILNHVPTSTHKDPNIKIESQGTVPHQNEKPHHQSHPYLQKLQQYSPVKLQVSILSGQQNDQSLNTEIIDPFFLSSERFFDKEINSPPKKKISYKDVTLYDTLLANQIKPRESVKKDQPNWSYFTKSLNELYVKVTGFKYSLPTILLLLGLLLLLIQTSK